LRFQKAFVLFAANRRPMKTLAISICILFVTSICVAQEYSEISGTGFPDLKLSSVTTGDLNNDGYSDVILAGITTGGQLYTKAFVNDADGTFSSIEIPDLPQLYNAVITLGDYNGDGLLDILATGEGYDPIVRLLKNNGDLTFSNLATGLENLAGENAELRDIDLDGDLDVMLSGSIRNQDGSYSSSVRLYKNIGNNQFTRLPLSFTSYASNGVLGDFDNDGDLDVMTCGVSIEIYPNNGNGSFSSPRSFGITFVAGDLRALDFNNDGHLDFMISGRGAGPTEYLTHIYRNNNNTSSPFSKVEGTPFDGMIRGDLDIRDYNADGFVDILHTGTIDFSQNSFFTKLFTGNGQNFIKNSSVSLPSIGSGNAEWFDLENDGDLDIILTGEEVQGANVNKTLLFVNNRISSSNTPNTPPASLFISEVTVNGNTLTTKWNPGTDAESASASLTYSIALENFDGGYRMSAEGNLTNGKRFTNMPGICGLRKEHTAINVPNGRYKVHVQSVDDALAGGNFVSSLWFEIGLPEPPSNLVASLAGSNVLLTWSDNANNETGFELEIKSVNGTFANFGVADLQAEEFSKSQSLSNGIYIFRIRAKNSNGSSVWVESPPFVVGIAETPSHLSATLNGSIVSLVWDDVINETAYTISKSINGGSFADIATPGANVVNYQDEIAGAGEYIYRVRAINSNGNSSLVESNALLIVGVESEMRTRYVLYPNPVQREGQVRLKNAANNMMAIKLVDMQGRTKSVSFITDSDDIILILSELTSGIYVLNCQDHHGKVVSQKLIIR
jgi:hypothetical protein